MQVSQSAKSFIDQLLCIDPVQRYSAVEASNHNWMSSFPALFKPKPKLHSQRSKPKLKPKPSLKFRDESWSTQPYLRKQSANQHQLDNDGTKIEMTLTNNSLNSRSTEYNGLVLPVSGAYTSKALTKEKILDDGSSMSPSNIDSMMATEDTNSIPSNLGLLHEYFDKFNSTDDPVVREQIRSMYLEPLLSRNNVTVPVQGEKKAKASDSHSFLRLNSKIKEQHIHEQFADINEDSEDEANLPNSKHLDLTKFDSVYSEKNGSVLSSNSLKSHYIPIETINAGYIEKVGVWLSGQNEDGNSISHQKYKTPELNLFASRRTSSTRSNLTMSDQSNQSSAFSRFLLPNSSYKKNLNDPPEITSMHHGSETLSYVTFLS